MKLLAKIGCVAAVFVAVTAWSGGSRASLAFQMTFEQAAGYSQLVIVGRVVESPEFGTADNGAGVVRRHRVKVEQYLKGSGGDEIQVYTSGGKFVTQTDHGPEIYEGSSDAPQLPEDGSSVVLFLRPWRDGYTMASASHGIIPVSTAKDGTRTVLLYFQQPELMPPEALAGFRENYPDAKVAPKPIAGHIRVENLRSLFDRLTRPKP